MAKDDSVRYACSLFNMVLPMFCKPKNKSSEQNLQQLGLISTEFALLVYFYYTFKGSQEIWYEYYLPLFSYLGFMWLRECSLVIFLDSSGNKIQHFDLKEHGVKMKTRRWLGLMEITYFVSFCINVIFTCVFFTTNMWQTKEISLTNVYKKIVHQHPEIIPMAYRYTFENIPKHGHQVLNYFRGITAFESCVFNKGVVFCEGDDDLVIF